MFFLYPLTLILLLIPLVYFFYSYTSHSTNMEKYFSAELLKKLSLCSSCLTDRVKYKLFLLTLVLFILSLARPVVQLDSLSTALTKPSVILALDVSQSMHYTDIYPSRLQLAKTKLKHFVSQAQGINLGILLYAKDAYVLYPLSHNSTVLSSLVKDLNLTHTFALNANLFAALEGSVQLLKKQENKHILLLSDGGKDVTRDKEIAYLKSNHVTLWSLATTVKENVAIHTLCTQSNGLYQPYKWGNEDITTLLNAIKQSPIKTQTYSYDIAQYEEYFMYPLFLALCFLLAIFFPLKKSKHVLLFFLLFTAEVSLPLKAGIFDFWHLSEAKEAYENKAYSKSIAAFKKLDLPPKGYYNLATSLYKSKKYIDAIVYYKKALGTDRKMNAKIYYNIATAYARKNKLDLAKSYYQKSLENYEYKIALDNLNSIKKQIKIERKNLHKEYEKLRFKGLGQNEYAQNRAFTNYAVKINTFLPTEEKRWFHKVMKHRTPVYLQKLHTTKRSTDENNTTL